MTQVTKIEKDQTATLKELADARMTITRLEADLSAAREEREQILHDAEFVSAERVLSLLATYNSQDLLAILKACAAKISSSSTAFGGGGTQGVVHVLTQLCWQDLEIAPIASVALRHSDVYGLLPGTFVHVYMK